MADRTEQTPPGDEFLEFIDLVKAPLVRALVAAFGVEFGREAAVDALAWSWEHWDRLQRTRNPAGYLYRVGLNAGRRTLRRSERLELRAIVETGRIQEDLPPDAELERALSRLSTRQRAAVLLVIGHGMPLREAADNLGCSVSTLRNHVKRALRHLRDEMGDTDVEP